MKLVSIVALEEGAIFVRGTDGFCFGFDVKRACASDGDSSDVSAFVFSFGDFGFDDIASLKTEEYFLPRASDSDTSEFVEDGAAAGAVSFASDVEDWHIPVCELCHIPYASGVESMGFRDAEFGTVKFGLSAGETFDWDTEFTEFVRENVAGDIDCGSILEWGVEFGQNGIQSGFIFDECLDRVVVFFLIARFASDSEVANAICTSFGFGEDVFDLKGYVSGIAVHAFASPFF
jgi:hypothetical protein